VRSAIQPTVTGVAFALIRLASHALKQISNYVYHLIACWTSLLTHFVHLCTACSSPTKCEFVLKERELVSLYKDQSLCFKCDLEHRSTAAWSLGSRVRIQLGLWMLISFVLYRQWPLWEADHLFRGVQRPDMGCCILKRSFHVKQDLNLCTTDRLTRKNSSCNEIDLILFLKKERHPVLSIRTPAGIPAALYVRKYGRVFFFFFTFVNMN